MIKRTGLFIALVLLLIAGYALSTTPRHTHAGGGYPPQVLTLIDGVGPVDLVDNPGSNPQIITQLHPGDRILRISGGIIILGDDVYIPVFTATGEAGWLRNGEEITASISPVYATSSALQVGMALTIKDESRAACRRDPTFRADPVQNFHAGETVTITGGPYQAELGLWWQVLPADAESCWLYDVPGLFTLVN